MILMLWFIHHDERILGPYETDQIVKQLKDGDLSYSGYIWSKGQVEWMPLSEWEENLEHYANKERDEKSDKFWKIRSGKMLEENLKIDDVMAFLKSMDNFQHVFVSAQTENDWTPIYSSYMFMEALNLSRRNFLRAPLMGLAKITRRGSRFSYVVKTATVGQGGLGVYGLGPNFQPGIEVQIKIESEDLSAPFNVVGSIVYNTDKGFVGIRFPELSAEANGIILDYIRKFKETDETVESKAS